MKQQNNFEKVKSKNDLYIPGVLYQVMMEIFRYQVEYVKGNFSKLDQQTNANHLKNSEKTVGLIYTNL